MRRTVRLRSLSRSALLVLLFHTVTLPFPPLWAQSQPSVADNPDAAFDRLTEEFLAGYLAARPMQAVSLGLHRYDGQLGDFSRVAVEAERRRLHEFDARLAVVPADRLNPSHQLDLRLLILAVRQSLFSIEEAGDYDRNPMTYAGALDVNVYLKRDFAPLAERLRSIVAVEKQASALFAAARANLVDPLPRPKVTLAITIARGAADFLANDLVAAVRSVGDQDPTLLAEFRDVNTAAIYELSSYATYLEEERLPKSTAEFALGPERYQRFLAVSEAVTLPPERILEIGLETLRREQAAFAAAARVIDPDKPAIEVFKAIQRDHPTAENLISDTKKNLGTIRQYLLDKQIITVPSEVRATVAETPTYLRATSFASMDTPGPFETKGAEAYYYVTPVEPHWPDQEKEEWLTAFNHYTSDVVSIHEAYPGHYVQFLHLNASPVSRVQKIFGSYAFIEGWAHYCEQMLLDDGFGSNNSGQPPQDAVTAAKFRLAQSDEALLRICRLCVSVMMHTQGMTVEEGAKFFQDNCYYEPKPAMQEAMRGTYDPGYLFYTLGKLQLLKLREDYKAQEGDGYTLKKFNDAVTDHGMPPVRFLREILLKDQAQADAIL